MTEQVNADAERKIQHPAPVREHRAGAASEARTEIRIKCRTAAHGGEFAELGLHRLRAERRFARRLRLSDGLQHQPKPPFELRTKVHSEFLNARRGLPSRAC